MSDSFEGHELEGIGIEETEGRGPRVGSRGRRVSATVLKLGLVALLSLLLLIPLGMLSGTTRERQGRQAEAIEETAASWAGKLELMSPVLVLPLVYAYKNAKNETEYAKRQAILYPERLVVDAELEPELRKRGIFSVPLFSCAARIEGSFSIPPLEEFGADAIRLLWGEASLALPLGGYQCLRETSRLEWSGRELALDQPKPDMDYKGAALSARLGGGAWKEASFSMALSLRGSESLSFLVAAKSSEVRLRSSWRSPSFFGSSLPDSRTLSESGTEASWKGVGFGLGPRVLEGGELREAAAYGPGFGFALFQPQGAYQKTDRALKYGLLFVIVPFMALFLFEAIVGARVHPIQYLFIGLANCLFFLLLLALSERIAFDAAFAAAAGAVTCLCSAYAAWVLPRKRDGFAMAGIFAALYAYLFGALKSEDYALLIGALGLFAILGLVMIATRKLDWYGLDKGAR